MDQEQADLYQIILKYYYGAALRKIRKDNNMLITHAWVGLNGNTIIVGPVLGTGN